MDRYRAAKQYVQKREVGRLLSKGGPNGGEKGGIRTFLRIAVFIVVGMTLLAAGCSTYTFGGANHSLLGSVSGRGPLGGSPGKCMGGAGGTRSGSTTGGMGSCASEQPVTMTQTAQLIK